ncbi:hypothetical protein [Parasulfuritortus cantonensis]|nr:hypothetical protein [Parasulfuritortus cantonensis]
MRVSSLSYYSATLAGIRDQQAKIARLSQQVATETKYLAAKDSPIEATRALYLADRVAQRTQYQANQTKAEIGIQEEQTVLNELDDALSSVRSLVMSTTGSEDAEARQQVAAQLSNLYQHIKSLANYKDSSGNYLFSGFQTDTLPYEHASVYEGAASPQSTTYYGDTGVRKTEIEAGRYLQTNDTLDTVMQAGTTNDLLSSLDQIATALRDGTATASDFTSATDLVSSALSNLRMIESDVSGRYVELTSTQESTTSLLQNDQNALSKLTELDSAAAIVELQQRQVTLQAAENTFSLTSQQSLFDYL